MKISPIVYTKINNPNYDLQKNKSNINNSSMDKKEILSKTDMLGLYYMPVTFGINSKSYKNPQEINISGSENKIHSKRTKETTKPKLAETSYDFKISTFADIPCPACGKKMLNKSKYNKIANELKKIPSDQYLSYLSNYKEYMRPIEESVYDELCALSKEEGASQDIRTLLVSLRDTKMPVLQKAQMRQINRMKALSKNLLPEEQQVLNEKINSLQKLIYKNNASSPFRRKIMIEEIKNIKIRNPKKYEKLQNIAKDFPTSSDMNSAWIVKYSGKDKNKEDWKSYDIALRLLSSSVANTDHIIAYSIENNRNDISNYMSMHNACNCMKENKSFLKWLYEDKDNRIKYIQDYLRCADELISNKIKDKKYKNYVKLVSDTIFEASKGQVKLFEDNNKKDSTVQSEKSE